MPSTASHRRKTPLARCWGARYQVVRGSPTGKTIRANGLSVKANHYHWVPSCAHAKVAAPSAQDTDPMKTLLKLIPVVAFACVGLCVLAHSIHHYCMSKADLANSPAMIATAKFQNAVMNAVGF